MSQEVANFFVTEAQRSTHSAKDEVEEDLYLIYNWQPAFTGKHHYVGEEVDFEQVRVRRPGLGTNPPTAGCP